MRRSGRGAAGAGGRYPAARVVELMLPVHPNPEVRDAVRRELADVDAVQLTEPLDYPEMVRQLHRCDLVLTDSGGLQEEAPSLGKPVLVMRDVTERPEGVTAGTARLVGTDPDAITAAVEQLLDDPQAYAAMAAVRSPYGDGDAAEQIAARCRAFLDA